MRRREPQTMIEAWEELHASLVTLRDALGWPRFEAWVSRRRWLVIAGLFVLPALMALLLVLTIIETI